MSLELVLSSAFLIVAFFCVGLVVLAHNVKRRIKIYFTLSISGLIGWVLTLFLSNIDTNFVVFFNRAVFISPLLALLFFGIFLDEAYGAPGGRSLVFRSFSYFIAAIGSIVALTPYAITGVLPRYANGASRGYSIETGPLYIVVLSVFVILFIALVFRGIASYKRSAPDVRQPLVLVFSSVAIAIVTSIFTNLLLPLFLGGSPVFNIISNLSIILFVLTFAYSVLRYRFLDIKAVIARAVTYLGVLLILFSLYVVLGFQLSHALSDITNNERLGDLVIFAISIVIALSYGPTKSYFDKITSRIFYQDTYDTQKFLEELNKTLVSKLDIHELLTNSSEVIEENLKSEYCTFYIGSASRIQGRIFGDKGTDTTRSNMDSLLEVLPAVNRKVFYQLDNYENEAEKKVSGIMAKSGVEVLVRLVSTLGYDSNGLGVILIGGKKSGNKYSSQDIRLLEIISNELEIAIENALRYEEIEKFNETLQQKIDDATRELKKSNDKLKALDEAKDEFVSMASHQLRTPLTSVKGYISMVAEEDVGKLNSEQKKMLAQALFSSQRMVYLIADLLNVSRLRTGKFVIEPKPTYLPKVVESEIAQLKEGAAAKDITLIYEKPKTFPTLNLDEMKIRQVIMNFTDNAIYYTPSGGKITLTLKDRRDSVEFTIKDTGIGVPAEERHKLFTKFYRANNARKARPDGTGLGLFMAKKVVVAQGGSIIFESAENKGSTFGFRFPKAKLVVKKKSEDGA